MGIFDFMFMDDPHSDVERAIDRAAKYYTRGQAADMVRDYFSEDDDLEREDRRLSIEMKKRSLGVNGKDYQDATNNDKSFLSHSMAVFGTKASRAIPDPQLLKPKFTDNIAEAIPKIFGGIASESTRRRPVASSIASILRRAI